MMKTARALSSTFVRTSRLTAIRFVRPGQCLHVQRAASRAPHWAGPTIQVRWQSQGSETGGNSKLYSFEEVRDLITKPSADRILIDTREPNELQQTGHIPTALNVPVSSSPDAFFLTNEDFEDKFGFQRPAKETEVIFYCKAGVRSKAAAQLARQAGWTRTGEYAGSWLDWAEKGGKVEKS